MVKLPASAPTPSVLRSLGADLFTLPAGSSLWRLHRTTGTHAIGWNELRHWGPSSTARFDPHEPPPRTQDLGVAYLSLAVDTAMAEVFQDTRTIFVGRGGMYLSGFETISSLELLDLTGRWPLRVGGSHAINTGRKDATRAWARAFVTAWPELDGCLYTSSMTGKECVALYEPGVDALPSVPGFSEPLAHPGLAATVATAAEQIGYRLS